MRWLLLLGTLAACGSNSSFMCPTSAPSGECTGNHTCSYGLAECVCPTEQKWWCCTLGSEHCPSSPPAEGELCCALDETFRFDGCAYAKECNGATQPHCYCDRNRWRCEVEGCTPFDMSTIDPGD